MPEIERTSAEVEHEHHHYSGNKIPWYVHLMWIAFWCFVVYYTAYYLIPAMNIELFERP
jgi:hypothetical protein